MLRGDGCECTLNHAGARRSRQDLCVLLLQALRLRRLQDPRRPQELLQEHRVVPPALARPRLPPCPEESQDLSSRVFLPQEEDRGPEGIHEEPEPVSLWKPQLPQVLQQEPQVVEVLEQVLR